MFKNSNKFLLVIIIIISFVGFCSNSDDIDLHSSIPALEKVIQTEKLYIENTEIFLKYFIKIFSALKSTLNVLKINNSSNLKDGLALADKLEYMYRTNDILTSNYIIEFSKNISNLAEKYNFPNDFDLEGVTRAINRLQDVYNYSAKEIAFGTFLEAKHKRKRITAADCFEIGHKLFTIGKENEAEEWFDLAYELYDKNDENNFLKKPVEFSVILDFVSYSKFRHGDYNNVKRAIELVKRGIKADPTHTHLQVQLETYKKTLKILQKGMLDFSKEGETYKMGCQGKFEKISQGSKKTYCTYKFGLHPFLKLAPIKVEISHVDPYVAVFHDILYESEIEVLKKLTSDELSRALVWNAEKAKSEVSHLRTSKIRWLDRNAHPVISVIDQRLADMTDMDMDYAEMLQVMNYGIGGHYDIHHDCFDEPDELNGVNSYVDYNWGNRIATVLFYMSDVEQGGATVYPHIYTAVKPKKGTAAFWFNMLPQGRADLRTRHAACPVAFGSKWVANKWIRYNGQVFNRQCSKNKDENYHTFSYL